MTEPWWVKPARLLITVLVLIVLRLLWLGGVQLTKWAVYAWHGEPLPKRKLPRSR